MSDFVTHVTSGLPLRILTCHPPENIDSPHVRHVLDNQHVTRSIYENILKFNREEKCFAGEGQIKLQMFPWLSGRHLDAQYGFSTLSGTLGTPSDFP